MDEKTSRHFAEIIELAESVFENVAYEVDATPDRSILRINAEYGKYVILVTELFSDGLRKYRYYVLHGKWVEAGFDNAPDPRAIRLKYGQIGEEHAGENIPHLHREDKTQLYLTEEMTFAGFVDWLKINLL
ncbi:MAG: hypothetical protein IH589_13915 [Anaerolineales bacterium]|nr:hypothetical protein [Anaerolineales bacterium]